MRATGRRQGMVSQAVSVALLVAAVVLLVKNFIDGQSALTTSLPAVSHPPDGAVLGGPVTAFDATYGDTLAIFANRGHEYLATVAGERVLLIAEMDDVPDGERARRVTLHAEFDTTVWSAATRARLVPPFQPAGSVLQRTVPTPGGTARVYTNSSLALAFSPDLLRDARTDEPVAPGLYSTFCGTDLCYLQLGL